MFILIYILIYILLYILIYYNILLYIISGFHYFWKKWQKVSKTYQYHVNVTTGNIR